MSQANLLFRFSGLLLFLLPAVYFFLLTFFNEHLLAHPNIQLWITRSWVAALFLFLFFHWGRKTTNRIQSAKEFLFEPMSPMNLAAFRIAHFSFYFIAILFFQMNVGEKMTMGYAHFPSENRVPIPGAEWYSLHVPVTPAIVDFLAPIFNVSAILVFLGLFTRVSSLVFLAVSLYLVSVHQMFGKVGNSHHLIWFPAILAFSDSGRMLSLDALIRRYIFKKPADNTPSAKYGFPIKTAILLLGIIYFFPGFWKIWNGGFDWIFRLNLSYHMYFKWASLDYWTPFFRIDHYPVLVMLGSIFAIGFELGFIFLVLKPGNRLWLALCGTLFHITIYLFMKIAFFVLMINYVVLIDWEKFAARFKKHKNSSQQNSVNHGIPWKEMKGALAVSIILLSGNFIFGIAKLTSYPFACYPTFDDKMPHAMPHVQYAGYRNGEIILNSGQVRKRLLRSRPVSNLSNVEDVLLHNHAVGNRAAALSGMQQLFPFPEQHKDIDSVLLYRVMHPLQPELRTEEIEKKKIGTFYPNSKTFHLE